ncbi:S8 family serine peptidase [uncultured Corynebacterium sp.]|uniref:S8 family serine peptidase n=1 Tax=uncultured Corynebacterium sp. TaxID=159447 RepID=UPI0025D487EA|nr:S8 family serine peptidase [uncultured Corynebacterium sp.]
MSAPEAPTRPTVAERVLRFRDAWPLADGTGVTVAVIDTGVADHPRLGGVADGGDVTGGAGAFHDCDAHGTFVAGLAAGRPGDDAFAGVAPGATVLSIRQTAGDAGTLASLATAIDSAVAGGARVINVSLTSCAPPGVAPQGSAEVTGAVQRAEEAGAVVVAAAGNTGADCTDGSVAWPALLDEVVAVTAVDVADTTPGADPAGGPTSGPVDDATGVAGVVEVGGTTGTSATDHVPASYALTAEWVDVAAPGGPVLGPSPDGASWADLHVGSSQATPIMGTSFAAPLVSGTAALILSRRPDLSPAEVRRIIAETASPAALPTGIGVGIVDPVAAVHRTGLVAHADDSAGSASAPSGSLSSGSAAAPTPPPVPNRLPTHRVTIIALLAAVASASAILWFAGRREPERAGVTRRPAPPRA